MSRRQAFTLIELLVVIAIIGILSGLIVVAMGGVTQKANIAKAQVFSNSLKNSLLLNLISEWKLDQILGSSTPYTTPDSWSGGNTGTLTDASGTCSFTGTLKCPQLVTSGCVSGNCLSFDGVDDYVDCGNGENLSFGNKNFTMSAWIKSSTVTNSYVISKRITIGYWFIANTGGLGFYIRDASSGNIGATSANNIYDGNWHNLVGIRNNPNLYLYLDGILVGGPTNASSVGSIDVGSNLFFGMQNSLYWGGSIDDVRIFNAAMPTSQIEENYYAGLNKLLANKGITEKEYKERLANLDNFSAYSK